MAPVKDNFRNLLFEVSTVGIQTIVSEYDTSKRMNTASLRLTAPEGFTYICPLVAVQPDLIPCGSQSIPNPAAAECRVDDQAENILNIHFADGVLLGSTLA